MAGVEGVVDLNIEAQAEIPMLRIQFDQDVLSRHGMSAGQAADAVEMAFSGKRVSQVLEGQVPIDMVLRYDNEARRDLDAVGNTLISTPLGPKVPFDRGPNYVGREAVQRRIVVSCNVVERSLLDVVNEIQQRVARAVQFPRGYRVEYGG